MKYSKYVLTGAGVILLIIFSYFLLKPRTVTLPNNTGVNLAVTDDKGSHDVKYYFDTIEKFDTQNPNPSLSKKVTVKGKAIKKADSVACLVPPCSNPTATYLEDINNSSYKIYLYNNEISKKLDDGKMYIVYGELTELLNLNGRPFEQCTPTACHFEISLLRPESFTDFKR